MEKNDTQKDELNIYEEINTSEDQKNKDENKSNEDEIKTPIKNEESPNNKEESNFQRMDSEKSNNSDLNEEMNIYNSTPLPYYNNELINKKSKEEKVEKENITQINITDLENIKFDDFNEKKIKYPRKYSSGTRKCGQKYFFYRNLKQKDIKNHKEEIRKKNNFLLIVIEKSIFYFNLKKYKECIELLLNEQIIRNNVEFGEFLLVIDGFDKDKITDFLSDENNIDILENYLDSINMDINNTSFLNTLRFFLSCLNFPNKDIIQKFSTKYFNLNKDIQAFIKNYKTLEVFSSLVTSIISINNIFIGKEKSNILKMDHFVKMNKNLEKKLCQNLYKEIQAHPIYPLDNYIQSMYKKLTFLVEEYDESEVLDRTDDIDSYYEKILNDNPKREYTDHNIWFSYRKKISLFNKEDEEILIKPIFFTKFVSNSTSCHPRVFAIQDNYTNLVWAKNLDGEKLKGNLHTVKIEDIDDIFMGVSHSEVLYKYLKSNIKEMDKVFNYISIKTKNDLIVIRTENINISFKWFKALKSLIYKIQKYKYKERERTYENKKSKIENGIQKIWKNCIYPKWVEYGKYLLYKKQNKIEYKKVFNSNIKKEKIIKSDIIDEKLNFNLKKIMFFMNGIKNRVVAAEGKEEIILDYNEFLFLYKIGVPHPSRNVIWESLIDNSCGLTLDLYEYYCKQIDEIDFKEKKEEYNNNKGVFTSLNEKDELINKIIIDIIQAEDLFINELYILQNGVDEILYQIYKLVRVFFLMRRDIYYNKNLINYAFIFILIFNDEYISFKNLFNFICTTNIIKYFIKDESFIEKNYCIFDNLIKIYVPKIYSHFNNLGIGSALFSVSWFENIFTQTLNYKVILRIIDLFLIYGDELLFKIGLTILKIQQEDLLNYTINEVFKVLKRLPNKFDEELFFENLELMDIHEKYNTFIVKSNLNDQKNFISENNEF